MYEGLVAALASLFLGWTIIRFRTVHEKLTGDTVVVGPQKIHSTPVPRIGGLAIFLGFLCGVGVAAFKFRIEPHMAALVALCALPAFAGGFYEDLSKNGGVLLRLAATFVSAILAFWLLGARLDRLDFPLADEWLRYGVISIFFTMFAAGGVSQSINIIDGLNGLAGFVGMVILGAIGLVAWHVGDQLILTICISAVGGILGFFVWNFPRGKIFCGDGGAYFVGFLIAEVSVLIVHRHREVSAWFPLLLSAYPVWETMFSMYRRRMIARKSTTQPDALHLHSLVYRWVSLHWGGGEAWMRNAVSSALCWLLVLFSALMALLFWRDTLKLTVGAFAFAAVYLLIYSPLSNKRLWRHASRGARSRKTGAGGADALGITRADQPV